MKFQKNTSNNIVSVSWGDHLVFGEGDGKLSTPETLQTRMECWRDKLGARSIHWRQLRSIMDLSLIHI